MPVEVIFPNNYSESNHYPDHVFDRANDMEAGEAKKMLHDTLANLESKVSFTCDVWTACTSRVYLTLTAHYVDNDWCLRSKILNLRQFPPPHTGNDLGLLVYDMIKEWKLEKKVMCMTVDNASNMDAMIPVLSSKLHLDSPLFVNDTYFHIRCSAHILNLIAHDCLKAIDPTVILVRENVKYIDSFEARLNRFRDCISDLDKPANLKLWLDVPTRWISTYLMLERCLNYQTALNMFGTKENGFFYRLSPTDWLNVAKMTALLEPFYEITKMFSGTEYPTANLYLEQVCRIEHQLHKAMGSLDAHVRSMGEYMYAKFKKYWSVENDLLCIAAILDPRHKLEFVEYHLRRVSRSEVDLLARLRKIREAMFGIFNEYKGHANSSLGVQQNFSSHLPRSGNAWRDEVDDYESNDASNENATYYGEKSELENYLEETRLRDAPTDFDILQYWKSKWIAYPILAAMARDILAVPISTVASESIFSMNGRILSQWRAFLLFRHVEVFVTTRNWLYDYEEPDEAGIAMEKDPVHDAESHADEARLDPYTSS